MMRWLATVGIVLTMSAASASRPPPPTSPRRARCATYMASLQLPKSGWAKTAGGRGGRIIRVTTLAATGPGSLKEALETKGPRVVVFEVGGQIDLGEMTLDVKEPFLTIAGQTAPSPGITLIRGKGLAIHTHDVIVQHIRVRTGDAGHPKASGWSTDGVRTEDGAYDVIIDHCSLYWATNKIAAVSGSRFKGATPDDWRNSTSHRITYSSTIIAEALSRSSHWKIEHSKGALIHDNTTGVLLLGNLFAHDYERSPLFKGGVHGAIVNNLIYDPGQRAIHYNLIAEEWGPHPYQVGMMSAVGNVLRAGVSTPPDLAFLEIGGDGDLEYYGRDNIAVRPDRPPVADAGLLHHHDREDHRGRQTAGVAGGPGRHPRPRRAARRAGDGGRAPLGPRLRRRPPGRRRRRGPRLDHRQRGRRARQPAAEVDPAAVQPGRLEPRRHDAEVRRPARCLRRIDDADGARGALRRGWTRAARQPGGLINSAARARPKGVRQEPSHAFRRQQRRAYPLGSGGRRHARPADHGAPLQRPHVVSAAAGAHAASTGRFWFDNRGTGESDTTGGVTVGQMADDALAVLDAAGADRAHVYGVSMGGGIAAEFAMRYPGARSPRWCSAAR